MSVGIQRLLFFYAMLPAVSLLKYLIYILSADYCHYINNVIFYPVCKY
jgi:hypothetical protein